MRHEPAFAIFAHCCGMVYVTRSDCLLLPFDRPMLRFRCPECRGVAAKTVNQQVYRALSSAGVAVARPHPEPHAPGPVIGYDDLLDFAVSVRDEARFAEAVCGLVV